MPAFIGQMGLWDFLAFGAVAWLVIRGFLRGCSGEVSGLVGLLAAAALGYFGFAPVERTVLAAKLLAAIGALSAEEQAEALEACEQMSVALWDALSDIYDKHCAM